MEDPAHCDLGLGAEFAFDFIRDTVVTPPPNHRVNVAQKLVFIRSTQTHLALRRPARVLE